MKKIVVAAVVAVWCVPSATFAGERVGDAALGALSGAVVLGPVGAVAGAVIGYTAGPSIADSWGLKRSEPRQSAKLPAKTTSKRVSSTQEQYADTRSRHWIIVTGVGVGARFHNTIDWFGGLIAAYVACAADGDASDRISQQWIA
jgi:hypothetical protein